MTPTKEILKAYEQTNSIDGTQKATGFSWQRIAKTLASNGIIANETQALIIGLYEDGKSMEEIQKCTGFTLDGKEYPIVKEGVLEYKDGIGGDLYKVKIVLE